MTERNNNADAMRRGRFALTLGAALVLAACAGTPKAPPPMDLPKTAEQTAPAAMTDWWRSFGDPVLDAYVAEALAHNSDVELAAARVRQSRGALAAARTNLLPTVDVGVTVRAFAAPTRPVSRVSRSSPIPSPAASPWRTRSICSGASRPNVRLRRRTWLPASMARR